MDNEPEPEVIHRQMEVQRAALTDKLETLETKIVATVDDAREAVADTVESVREGVKDSVASVQESVHTSAQAVKDTFDLPLQVERHPWPMFGGAIAVGFAAGWALQRSAAPSPRPRISVAARMPPPPPPPFTPPPSRPEPNRASVPVAAPRNSWTEQCFQMFRPELEKLKGMVVGAVLGVVREMVTEPLPNEMRSKVSAIMDNITTKLGGDPVTSETVAPIVSRLHGDHHNGHHREQVHGNSFGNDWRTPGPESL
jgi:ElaB/YqjD/DUF883 family membrane-anchored ribosome-binding protein